ncbi:hypothetical protein [Ekhidna sp.]
MKRINSFTLLTILVFFFISEDFILKWLPVNDVLFSLSRFAGELALYGLTAWVMMLYFLKHGRLRLTPLDGWFLLMIFTMTMSSLINGFDLIPYIVKLRIFFRYVSAYYLVIHLRLDEKQVKGLIKMIVILGVFQVSVGLYQQIVETRLSSFWLPRDVIDIGDVVRGFKEEEELKPGLMVGTMSMHGQFGVFIAIACGLLMCLVFYQRKMELFDPKRNSKIIVLSLLFLLLGNTLSHNRSSVLLLILAFPLVANFTGARKDLFKLTTGITVILVPLVLFGYGISSFGSAVDKLNQVKKSEDEIESPIDELKEAFDSEYYETQAKLNRLWYMQVVGTTSVLNLRFFGYGPNEYDARYNLWQEGAPVRILVYSAFKDVYWFNTLAHFGFFGVFALAGILIRIYTVSKSVYYNETNDTYRFIAVYGRFLAYAFAFGSIFAAFFEFRPNILIFWIITGIVVNRHLALKRN